MSMALFQLWGMTRYELLMSWRRGPARLLLGVCMLMPVVGFSLFVSQAFKEGREVMSQLPAESAMWLRAAMTIGDNMFLLPIILFLIPLLLAETVPLDRQYKVRELIDSLPIGASAYLGGKLTSAWLMVCGAATAAALINTAMSIATRGMPYAGPLATFWLGGVLPLALLAATMGVLVPAGQPERRRAVLAGGAAALATVIGYLILPLTEIFLVAFVQATYISSSPALSLSKMPRYPNVLEGMYLARTGMVALALALAWLVAAWSNGRAATQ